MTREEKHIYRFKTFHLDVGERQLLHNSAPVPLTPKAFDVLVLLVQRCGHLVEKEELMQSVWSESFVEEANLARLVHTLRKTLGDDGNGNKFIETVAKKGYRFVAGITLEDESPHIQHETSSSDINPTDSARKYEIPTATVAEPSLDPSKPLISHSFRHVALLAIAVFSMVIILSGGLAYRFNSGADSRFQNMKLKGLTTSGNITFPAISPDARFFAFVKTESGKQSLWIRQVSLRTSEIELTEPKTDEIFTGVTFTPDGSEVYFLLKPRNNSVKQLYSVPIFGGQPAKAIINDVDSTPTFAPEGKRFAFMRRDTKAGMTALFLADKDGSDVRELAAHKAPFDFLVKPLAWSPNGETIVCFSTKNDGSADHYMVQINISDGRETTVSEQSWIWVDSIVWTKSGEMIFSASDKQKPLGLQIWSMNAVSRIAGRLTNNLDDFSDITVAGDTGEISVMQAQWESSLWLAEIKSPDDPRRISPNKTDGSQGIAWKPDGDLIYTSVINGRNNLQRVSMPDFSIAAITADDKYVFRNPTVTPDGRYLVYTSNQNDPEGIWRMDIDGRNPKRLAEISGDMSSCSPDSRTIYFSSATGGHSSLWKVSIDGGESQRLSDKIASRPKASPDGTRIAFYFRAEAKAPWQIAIMPIDEDRILQTIDIPKTVSLNAQYAWTRDGSALILIDSSTGMNNLWRYPLNGQPPTQLTNFADDSAIRIINFAFSPNDQHIALTRGRRISDAVLISP